jgi:hypothetical protein
VAIPVDGRDRAHARAAAVISAGEFDTLFDSFSSTVYRLETLPAYDVGGAETARLAAFREHRPRPERSVRTDPWLARIAVTTVTAGKRWARTRIVDDPLTEYQRYQLASYVEAQAVGDEMRVAMRADVDDAGPDFWLFDAATPEAFAVVMRYDEAGHWLGAERVDDPSDLEQIGSRRATADAVSVPFNEFLTSMDCG